MVGTALCGREHEIETLAGFVDDIAFGGGRTIVIDGPVGIGKSRLLQSIAERATVAGVRTGRAAARPGRASLSPLLSAVAGGGQALLSMPKKFESMDSTERVLDALEWLADALVQRAHQGPVLVAVDDLQWADRFTLFALPALVSHLSTSPVGLLLARQPLPNARYVNQSVTALANAGAAFMSLQPLSPEGIAELAADALQAEPGSVLLEKLAGAGGNPLVALDFVREASRSTEAGTGTSLLPSRYAHCSLPSSLLKRLLAPLSEASRHVAELAAALGTSFATGNLAELTGYGPDDLAAAIEELLQAGLVVDDAARLRFRHELLRKALASRLTSEVKTAAESLLARRAGGADRSPLQSDDDRLGWDSLTAAELRIARLVAEGLTNREIAARLTLSPHTIDYHLKHVFSKLRAHSRVQLARIMLSHEPGQSWAAPHETAEGVDLFVSTSRRLGSGAMRGGS
jgi:DNA-binding CsgD family transcriptional regulator